MNTVNDRATCWSLTINNYTPEDINVDLPAGWKLMGQPEIGENGTSHAQLMLTTPQVRFSAVKRAFPRAHIEAARNRAALSKYVQKEETRAGESIVRQSNIPTLFDYQVQIAEKWDEDEFQRRWHRRVVDPTYYSVDPTPTAMAYLDDLVAADVENGMRGVEFIAINPMWRSSWSRFWRSIINRQKKILAKGITQDASVSEEENGSEKPCGA